MSDTRFVHMNGFSGTTFECKIYNMVKYNNEFVMWNFSIECGEVKWWDAFSWTPNAGLFNWIEYSITIMYYPVSFNTRIEMSFVVVGLDMFLE